MLKPACWMTALGLALALSTGAEEVVEAAPAEDTAMLEVVEPAESVTVTPIDVWWGNRSISHDNYIKFDKVDAHCADPATEDCICPGCVGADCPPPCADLTWDKIFFDLDKSMLRPASIVECQKILAYLNANPKKGVFIEGHCCDWATDQYNVGLGQRRANAVRQWLIEQGIAPERLQTKTFGETNPWVGNEQRELNRRAIVTATP
jgi:outer membrane protein OmpA-like peptidoglycan-associated protein